MKQTIKKLFLAIVLLAGVLVPSAQAYAASGSISLSASRSTVPAGGNLIIAIYVNGGGNNVNAVEANLTYSASKLQYVGFSATGSAFEIGATNGGGDGTATLGRGTTSPVNGSALLGTVTFKALAGSGSTSIDIAGSSSLVSDGNSVPYGSSGVSVNFGVAAASPSGAGAAKPAAAAAPEPPKDTTAPKVSAVKVIDLTPFNATITWSTDEAADSSVEYGLDTAYGLSASAVGKATTHSVALTSGFMTPLTLLHYRVKSADAAGNVTTGTDQTFQLPGVPVTVVVRGADGKPQPGAEVTIDGTTGITDAQGSVTLRSSLGNKKVITTYNGVTVQRPITVGKSAKPLPPIQLDLAKKPLNHWMLSTAGLLVLVLALIAIDGALFGSRILARLTGIKFAYPHRRAVGAAALAGARATSPAVQRSTATATAVATPPLPPVTVVEQPEPVIAQESSATTPEIEREHIIDPTALSPSEAAAQDPEIDMNQSIDDLMNDEPVQKSPLISHIAPEPATEAPLTMSLEPIDSRPEPTTPLIVPTDTPVAAHLKPSAPLITPITVTHAAPRAADLAERLKPKTESTTTVATKLTTKKKTPKKTVKKTIKSIK